MDTPRAAGPRSRPRAHLPAWGEKLTPHVLHFCAIQHDATALIRDAIGEKIAIAHTEPSGNLRDDLLAELNVTRDHLHDPAVDRALRMVIERAVAPAFSDLEDALYREGTRGCAEIIRQAKARGELDVTLAVEKLLGPLFFRRLLGSRSFDTIYVRRVVDDFLVVHRTPPR
ncbi:TetR-like C-terminal domain-containing protein [Streptomyces sp. NPDC001450]